MEEKELLAIMSAIIFAGNIAGVRNEDMDFQIANEFAVVHAVKMLDKVIERLD